MWVLVLLVRKVDKLSCPRIMLLVSSGIFSASSWCMAGGLTVGLENARPTSSTRYVIMVECYSSFLLTILKNLVWTFALFWYCIYNDFDCSYLFDYTYIVLVNLAFTSLPVIFMGIFDQDVDDKVSLAVPQLYMRGIERKEWSQLKF